MEFISVVEIIGTIAFAMSGALLAIKKDMDYYGIVLSAIVTSVGGGIVRDIIINTGLPNSLANPIYIIISILSAVITIIFYKKIVHLHKLHKLLLISDTIGLGAFTAIGAEVAVMNNFHQPSVIITLAVLTGTGGGVIRDIFAKEIPYVFLKEVYAVASILGAVLFILVNKLIGNEAALYVSFMVTVIIRMYCLKKNIHLKKVLKEERKEEPYVKHTRQSQSK